MNWVDSGLRRGLSGILRQVGILRQSRVVQRTKIGLLLSSFKRQGLYTVVALHHSPYDHDLGMKLRDHEEFLKKVDGVADLVLFGHTHVRESYRYPKVGDKAPLTRLECAGSLQYENTEILKYEVPA